MGIQKKYIQVFVDLNSTEKGLLGFTMHTRYSLTPSEVVDFILKYRDLGYITCDQEYRIKITELGRQNIYDILNKRDLNKSQLKGSYYFQQNSSDNRLKINEPYIPDFNFLELDNKIKILEEGET